MSFPKNDQVFPDISEEELAQIIAYALRKNHGHFGSAVKQIGRLINAEPRTIRNWYEGRNTPSLRHFLILARHSPSLVESFLSLVGHGDMVDLFDGTEIVSKVPKTKIYSVSSVTINVTLPLARVADLNQRQLWLLGRLQQGLISKADDIEAAWGVTLRTAKRDIAGLINLDLIYFHGARKNGRYQLWNNPKY